jgi:hypothetical protein
MMSTELLMAAVTEPAGARPVSGDLLAGLDKSQGASFAESFNERVGASALLQKDSSTGTATITLPGFKGVLPGKGSDDVAEMSDGVKGKAGAILKVSANGELTSGAADKAEKIVPTQTATLTAAPEKTAAGGSKLSTMKNVMPSGEEGKVADDVSPDAVPLQATATGLTDKRVVPEAGVADEDQPLASSGDGVVVQKETGTAGEMEDVSAKKTAKTQESTVMAGATAEVAPKIGSVTMSKIAPKPAAKVAAAKTAPKIVNADSTATSGSATSPSMEAAIPGVIPGAHAVVTVVTVPQSGGGAVDRGPSQAVSGMAKTSPGVAPSVEAPVRKDVAQGTKATVMDAGSEAPFTDDQLVSPKAVVSGVGPEKTTAVAAPGNVDNDSKTPSASGPMMGQIHMTTGGSSPIAAGVILPGDTKGDLTAEKVPVREASAQTAGLPVGASAQDGPNVVATSMDGMPRMLTATPTALEVGIQNGTHGWLKVRAEMADGGVVNASVSASSSAGQEMLHRELPAMTAYLQGEKVAVSAIVVHAPLAAGAESRSSTGTDSAGGQMPQRNSEGGEQQNVRKGIAEDTDKAMSYQSSQGMDEDGSLSLATYASGGSWLSVRA